MESLFDLIFQKEMEDQVSISSFTEHLLDAYYYTAYDSGITLVYKFNEYESLGFYDDYSNEEYSNAPTDVIMVASDVMRKSLVTVCHGKNKTIGVYTSQN